MKIHPAPQGTLEWLCARAGIPTASEFDNIISPTFEIRKGETPKTYLAKKVAEAWTGTPAIGFNSIDMDFGQILEQEALPFYTLETGREVKRVGLLLTDDGQIGCSPDGLFDDGTGIEVKCPEAHTHVRYLLDGTLPKDYAAQVHGAMHVTGAPRWTFMSYRRSFPALILTIERDDAIQEVIGEALDLFLAHMKLAMDRLTELNGGPPKRAPVRAPEPAWISGPVDDINP